MKRFSTDEYSKPIRELWFGLLQRDDLIKIKPNYRHRTIFAEGRKSTQDKIMVYDANNMKKEEVANIGYSSITRMTGPQIIINPDFECKIIQRYSKSNPNIPHFDEADILMRCVKPGKINTDEYFVAFSRMSKSMQRLGAKVYFKDNSEDTFQTDF